MKFKLKLVIRTLAILALLLCAIGYFGQNLEFGEVSAQEAYKNAFGSWLITAASITYIGALIATTRLKLVSIVLVIIGVVTVVFHRPGRYDSSVNNVLSYNANPWHNSALVCLIVFALFLAIFSIFTSFRKVK